jgi:hypothetical protein
MEVKSSQVTTVGKSSISEKTGNTISPPALFSRYGQVATFPQRNLEESTFRLTTSHVPSGNTNSGPVASNTAGRSTAAFQQTTGRKEVNPQISSTVFPSTSGAQGRNVLGPRPSRFQGLNDDVKSATVSYKFQERGAALPSRFKSQSGSELGPLHSHLPNTNANLPKHQHFPGTRFSQ